MAQTSFLPEAILVSAAGVIGATAAGQCVNLTAAQLRSFASVYSQAEVAAAFQPLDATLTALAGVTTAADKVIYATGSDAFSTTTLSSFGRSLIDDADASTARTTLGLGTMATQASSSYLALATGGTISAKIKVSATTTGFEPALWVSDANGSLGGALYFEWRAGAVNNKVHGIIADSNGLAFYRMQDGGVDFADATPDFCSNPSGNVGIRCVPTLGTLQVRANTSTSKAVVADVPAGYSGHMFSGYSGSTELFYVDASGSVSAVGLVLTGLTSLGPYTFTTLPSASANSGKCLRITDRGQKHAYSDGTNWLFVHDNSVVS